MNNFRPQSAVIRTEDPRFLTGAGEYVDDINIPNQTFGYLYVKLLLLTLIWNIKDCKNTKYLSKLKEK